MNLRNLRLVERWERLEELHTCVGFFLLFIAVSGVFFWIAGEPLRDPRGCVVFSGKGSSSGCLSCDAGDVMFVVLFGVVSGLLCVYIAFMPIVDIFKQFLKPLQSRAFSPTLRVFLLLKRMRLERVFKSDAFELSLTTLDDNHKPYQPFIFKINGIHKFNFYNRDNEPVSADCIFRGGALLEFSRVKDSAELDCARVMVSSQYQGAFYYGQLELEAESYEIRALAKARV